MRKAFIRRNLPFIFLLLLIILVGAIGYFYKGDISYKSTDLVGDQATQSLVSEVGKLIVLPTDEVPTVATVSNPDSLKDKLFFQDAKVGDKVLIYTNAKKAILYDPVLKKIINVGPINTGVPSKSQNSANNISPTSLNSQPEF